MPFLSVQLDILLLPLFFVSAYMVLICFIVGIQFWISFLKSLRKEVEKMAKNVLFFIIDSVTAEHLDETPYRHTPMPF